ncbi:conserved hypothetical protein [Methanolacinia petrolearia DSM 11571]|uniref:Uncharacterized protein n=1 Tax=Methanolacinia petrolearia (strain DSM 11571 / OCM 486 / SEBR 4847) TaxID=679926 RepID=E1RHK5_METP4|nr:hypothetical protein [Methanolacinia petrolearia]ADN35314.1 conserved hypothetical protein [Methanolacinia petrolearia DSM 11571]
MRTFRENGILSVDFLIGFSIFLLALIMILTMIPGIFAGLDSAQIDYDAVAYRTSVILCEDPGWPADDDSWEFMDTYHKDDIDRLGLAVSSTSPNILSKEKTKAFFNENENLVLDNDDYHSKVLFGEIPYYYNISLKIENDPVNTTGNIAPDSGYGYMRRLVKLKEPGYAKIDSGEFNKTNTTITTLNPYVYTGFSVIFDYAEIQNKSIDEAYRLMLQSEPASITIYNFSSSLNRSDISNVTLTKIRFINDDKEVPIVYSTYHNDTYRFFIDGIQHTMQGPFEISDADELKFEIYPPLMFSDEIGTSLSVVFNMTYEFVPDESMKHYYISGDIPYIYNKDYMTEPYLKDGVMEVMIW